MNVIKNPNKNEWLAYTQRPALERQELTALVEGVIQKVELEGNKALRLYTEKYDGVKINDFKASDNEFMEAANKVSDDLKNAISLAKNNIEAFHSSQMIEEGKVETTKGVTCWRKSVAIEKVGL